MSVSRAALRALEQAMNAGPRRDQRQAVKAPRRSGTDLTSSDIAVRDLLAAQGWEHLSTKAVLLSEWTSLVGADLAQHVSPCSLEHGILTLQATSTAWATQVRLLEQTIRTVLETRFGPGVITRIDVAGPTAPRWTAGPRRVPGRGPHDTYG